jgi:hypothetical protein
MPDDQIRTTITNLDAWPEDFVLETGFIGAAMLIVKTNNKAQQLKAMVLTLALPFSFIVEVIITNDFPI